MSVLCRLVRLERTHGNSFSFIIFSMNQRTSRNNREHLLITAATLMASRTALKLNQ